MSLRWLIATMAMTMAAPAMATNGSASPQLPGASVAERLYPTSPISDEGWQMLVHMIRIGADNSPLRPDDRKVERDDNRRS